MKKITKAVFGSGRQLPWAIGLTSMKPMFTLAGTRACTENSLRHIELGRLYQ
ncbi:MAG: hypothetical protein Q8J90_02825 [Gallionella sp.]|nr:hypothetical protein [Gallionella sp.]